MRRERELGVGTGSTGAPTPPRAPERIRATVMCGRSRRRSGSQSLTSLSATSRHACSDWSVPAGSPIATASERGRRGGSNSGPPTASSPSGCAQRSSATASASISATGRLPRKHSVRCSNCGSSTRSAGNGPCVAAIARPHRDSCSRASAGKSSATNSRAVAPRDIAPDLSRPAALGAAGASPLSSRGRARRRVPRAG